MTNSDWYSYMANKYKNIDVPIYGIPINLNEALGVLHLKGCIIDDYIFYSGASISNEYLNQFNTKYRYDRYQDISKILNLNKTVEIIVGDKISNDFYNPDNSIWVDRIWTLLTGNNFNARAWALDLENAILIHDPKQEIKNQRKQELSYIYKYTKRINSFQEIEKISDYPKKFISISYFFLDSQYKCSKSEHQVTFQTEYPNLLRDLLL
uniref:CDP-diacylglycerol--glycerol-3-phosphate 3-phosphatidyltransferase n=1 Tax=Glossina palpalis gambiensis TaxID=67801 RepID=A0A1B0C7P3_9MUSC